MKKVFFKVLIISILYLFMNSCKSQSNVTKKEKAEREDTTEDLRNEQMDDYENDLRDQYEENNQ
jgi:uncharacterized alpha/beta hydrolase family protein